MRIREIVVRYKKSEVPLEKGTRFANSRDVYQSFRDDLMAIPVEVFRVVILDAKNQMIAFEDVSKGSLSQSVAHPREVFWFAVYHRAAAVLLLHNHPTGDPAPSHEDRQCTQRLVQAGKILGIRVLDHIIVGASDYFSFADAALLTSE